jgi:hypothetical protein
MRFDWPHDAAYRQPSLRLMQRKQEAQRKQSALPMQRTLSLPPFPFTLVPVALKIGMYAMFHIVRQAFTLSPS